MTKDRKEYFQKWGEANKEHKVAYTKAWRKANKEKIDAKRQANEDGYYTVYLLVNENYVGQTKNLSQRLTYHKSRFGRDTTDVQILGKYKTKREALDVEKSYHNKGYLGKNPTY
tara:strand:- start:636 stop:977 length:342 start_codon:yes stop_codon:yes gene_type:complete